MGIVILLRTHGNLSYFKRYLSHLILCPKTNKLLLYSGYVSESPYYSTLDDGLLSDIKKGCLGKNSGLITVAGRFGYKMGSYQQFNYKAEYRYKRFVKKIANNKISNFKAYISTNKNWHAKIAIKPKDKEPVAGIIGSSNLTQPAYSENLMMDEFTYECDVLIWKKSKKNDNYFKRLIPQDDLIKQSDPFAPIFSLMDNSIDQSGEEERLKAVYEEIMNQELSEYEL